MKRSIIPHVVKNADVLKLSEDATVAEAAKSMMEWDVAAICIDDGQSGLIGIVTERDLTRRVLANGSDPKSTKLSEIMTRDPDCLSPTDSAGDALKMMQQNHYRHMPVVEGGKVVAMLSIRDLYAVVTQSLEEEVRQTEAYVMGHGYSA
ncbi:MAG: cyclic nucleotide-binding/CBS domain-containing protein [Magnetovibrionaceae bacterium]